MEISKSLQLPYNDIQLTYICGGKYIYIYTNIYIYLNFQSVVLNFFLLGNIIKSRKVYTYLHLFFHWCLIIYSCTAITYTFVYNCINMFKSHNCCLFTFSLPTDLFFPWIYILTGPTHFNILQYIYNWTCIHSLE